MSMPQVTKNNKILQNNILLNLQPVIYKSDSQGRIFEATTCVIPAIESFNRIWREYINEYGDNCQEVFEEFRKVWELPKIKSLQLLSERDPVVYARESDSLRASYPTRLCYQMIIHFDYDNNDSIFTSKKTIKQWKKR